MKQIIKLFLIYLIYLYNYAFKFYLPIVLIFFLEISKSFPRMKSQTNISSIAEENIKYYIYKSPVLMWLISKIISFAAIGVALFIIMVFSVGFLKNFTLDFYIISLIISSFIICVNVPHLLFGSYVKIDEKGIRYKRFFKEKIIIWKDIFIIAPLYRSHFVLICLKGQIFLNRYILFVIEPFYCNIADLFLSFYKFWERKEPPVIQMLRYKIREAE